SSSSLPARRKRSSAFANPKKIWRASKLCFARISCPKRQQQGRRNGNGNQSRSSGKCDSHAREKHGADRQSHQREDGKNHRRRSDSPGAASEIPPRGAHLEEILRA